MGEAPDLPAAHVRCVGGQGPLPSPGASLLPRAAHGWGGLLTLRPPVASGVGGWARGPLGGGQATVQHLLWSRIVQASAAWSTGGPGDTPAPGQEPEPGVSRGRPWPDPSFSRVSPDSGTTPAPAPRGCPTGAADCYSPPWTGLVGPAQDQEERMCSAGGWPTRSEETPAPEGGAGSSSPWVTGLCCWALLPSVLRDPQFPVQGEGYQDRGAGEDGL